MKYLLMIYFSVSMLCAQHKPWTWRYHKQFTQQELVKSQEPHEIIFSKQDIPQFTQLLFSWNGLRPKYAHYTFFVQVRDAVTKKWGRWHKMIEWGNVVQKSFETGSDGFSRYVHVRLETKPADGFKIKISAPSADFAGLRSVSVNTVQLKDFNHEDLSHCKLPSVHIAQVPQQSQLVLPHTHCRMMCSPTSCSMLLGYLTKKAVNPLHFAERSYDQGLGAYGSWPFNVAHAYELSEGAMQFYIARLHSFEQLHKKLKEGIPVVVSVRGTIEGAPKPYDKGHLLVVVGFDQAEQNIICHDPAGNADHETVKRYPLASFIKAWERSRRLAYVASPT